ncbi:MAG: hypothetical protein KBH21_00440 [Acetoanaerobium sp.]|nr:hypothetical protein [Acetoanaerobium sp.]
MYINFNLLKSKGIDPCLIVQLQFLKQSRIENVEYNFDFTTIETLGFISNLKNGGKRLSKKGADFLELLQIPDADENHSALADFLIDKYKNDEDKILCSKNKLVGLIAWFCKEVNITAKELYKILLQYWETEGSKYNKRLDYLFFKPENMYSKKNINDSRLFIWWSNFN